MMWLIALMLPVMGQSLEPPPPRVVKCFVRTSPPHTVMCRVIGGFTIIA